MRARVAGDLTSSRQNSDEIEDRFEVVEIPLKYHNPCCIAVDGNTGNLAVGVKTMVLIYGLCYKRLASNQKSYEDIKCLLELSFSFWIHEIAICEEFIVCCSSTKVQVVKLNLEKVPGLCDVGIEAPSRSGGRKFRHNTECSHGDTDYHGNSDWTDSEEVLSDSKTDPLNAASVLHEEQQQDVEENIGSLSTSSQEKPQLELPVDKKSSTSTLNHSSNASSNQTNFSDVSKTKNRSSVSTRSLKSHDSKSAYQDKASTRSSQSKGSQLSESYVVEDEHHVEYHLGEMAEEMKAKAEGGFLPVYRTLHLCGCSLAICNFYSNM